MNEQPIIFILDAGGTGFKFSAVQESREIIEPFTIPSAAPTLEEVLQKLITGFHEFAIILGLIFYERKSQTADTIFGIITKNINA